MFASPLRVFGFVVLAARQVRACARSTMSPHRCRSGCTPLSVRPLPRPLAMAFCKIGFFGNKKSLLHPHTPRGSGFLFVQGKGIFHTRRGLESCVQFHVQRLRHLIAERGQFSGGGWVEHERHVQEVGVLENQTALTVRSSVSSNALTDSDREREAVLPGTDAVHRNRPFPGRTRRKRHPAAFASPQVPARLRVWGTIGRRAVRPLQTGAMWSAPVPLPRRPGKRFWRPHRKRSGSRV